MYSENDKETLIFIEDSGAGRELFTRILNYMENNIEWYKNQVDGTNIHME